MRAFVVDAFTDAAFRGNPAGVVLLDAAVSAEWMQQVATELRHSETAFARPRDDGDFDLRWFTPAVEVDLCGHATLATAHVLAGSGESSPLRFHTRSGVLVARVDGADIELDFPAQPPAEADAPDGLLRALGIGDAVWTGTNGVDLFVQVSAESTVTGLSPDFAALASVPCRGVVVTAAANDVDFVSRWFGPRVGVDEDPVTGSAHCALAPFWAARSGRDSLVGAQLSLRGGRVSVRVDGDRVKLGGRAVTVLAGELLV